MPHLYCACAYVVVFYSVLLTLSHCNYCNCFICKSMSKQAYYATAAARMESIRTAKNSQDLHALVAACRQSPSVQRYLRVIADMQSKGQSTAHLDPKRLLSQRPELVACCGTDGYFSDGIFDIDVKAASANIARAAAGQVHDLSRLVDSSSGNKEPNYSVRLRFKPIGGQYSKAVRKSYRLAESFQHSDTQRFEWTIEMGKQVDALRKEVQAMYNIGVEKRMEDQVEPTLPLEIVAQLIEQHVTDPTAKEFLLSFTNSTQQDANTELVQRSLRGGTFYTSIRTSKAAWWYDVVVGLGMGGSHYTVPFNQDLFWELVQLSGNRKDFLCRFLLAWASYDGSILPGHFEVLVPFDTRAVSIKNLMVGLFQELFGIKPLENVEMTKIENGKSIVKLRVNKKAHRKKIAETLWPYRSEYLSRDRMENLDAHRRLDV